MKHKSHDLLRITTLTAAAIAMLTLHSSATDYLWGGGNLDWSDVSPSGWNGGPPSSGDTATINIGTVTLTTNNLVNPLSSVTIGGTGKVTQTTGNTWSDFSNLTLGGGTLEAVRSSGDAFGAYQLSNTVTVNGGSASAISTNGTGAIFINLGKAVNDGLTTTTFNVDDVTSSPATDLTVSTVLANNIATDFASFSAAGLTKSGVGTMALLANNTYTGGTIVNAGVLEVTGSADGNGHIRGSATVNSGAELRFTGGDGTGFGFNSGNKLDTLTINGGLVNSLGIHTHLWGAAVNMTGGELRVNDGASSPSGYRIEWYQSTINTSASSASATISGRINLRGDGGNQITVFNVSDGSATTDLRVSAAITESVGSTGITKNGEGTMELSGTNSYTGNTTVNDGELIVTASGSLRFRPTTNGATNSVNGSATALLSFVGTIDLDLSAADATIGNAWNLFNLGGFTGPAPTLDPTAITSGLGSFTEVTPGTWELTASEAKWVFTEADGMLACVNPATDYENWKTANGVIGGVNDDDDSDGLTNRVEYAFGLNPKDGSSVQPITVQLNQSNGAFSYSRRLRSLTGLTYSIWYSTDLSGWTQDTGAAENTPVVSGEVETVLVTISETLLTNPTLFIQVHAE